ncbi:hypothetical protein M569_02630 [Genlisea aurea]|uniref:Uncharacterized protein n=1 Tax=Genlisea aurea TaxID=192259 RepID=S8CXE8_9LAMI|nr:hypothetical protein M569_02630 [Genlisea aurea]
MNQLTGAVLKWSRLFGSATQPSRRFQVSLFSARKLFSTEASEPSVEASYEPFNQTPYSGSGSTYLKLVNISKYTTKSDVLHLLDGINLKPESIRVEYDRAYYPVSIIVELPSVDAFEVAGRAIATKGRLFNLAKTDKDRWDLIAPFDGKAILLREIPRNAGFDDIERFLSGCQYDSSSLEIFFRPVKNVVSKMALVRFPSPALAAHAYMTKNGGFVLNSQICVQLLH